MGILEYISPNNYNKQYPNEILSESDLVNGRIKIFKCIKCNFLIKKIDKKRRKPLTEPFPNQIKRRGLGKQPGIKKSTPKFCDRCNFKNYSTARKCNNC